MIKLIDDTNVITDQWGFTEFWFCNPPTGGYKEWEFSISLPYDFIRGGENSKYVGSIHICLNGETNWTLENLVIFYLAEKFGYEVVMYGHKNLLPFFSLVSHKAIVSDNTHLDRTIGSSEFQAEKSKEGKVRFFGVLNYHHQMLMVRARSNALSSEIPT